MTKIITVSLETLDTMLSEKIEPIYSIIKGGEEIMNYKQASKWSKLSEPTLRRAVEEGRLVYIDIGGNEGERARKLFHIDDLRIFMSKNRVVK